MIKTFSKDNLFTNVERLVASGQLPDDFILSEVAYKDGNLEHAFGQSGEIIFSWDSNGKGFSSYDSDDTWALGRDEDGMVQFVTIINLKRNKLIDLT